MSDLVEPQSLKRRRVSRACDECRRKKIKCDGRMPCTHCTVYSYNCTFDQPSNRRRHPPPGYLERLEERCARYEELLKQHVPQLDLKGEDREQEVIPRQQRNHSSSDSQDSSTQPTLESMLGPSLHLNKDDEGNIEFRGNSSGAVFVQSVSGHLGITSTAGVRKKSDPFGVTSISRVKGTSPSNSGSKNRKSAIPMDPHTTNGDTLESTLLHDETEDIPLPDYEVALELTRLCFNNACSIIQFVHQPTFYKQLRDHYADEPGHIVDDNFLSVLYSTLAVGCLFVGTIVGHLDIEEPRTRAFQYFQASKSLIDPLDRANTGILQTLLCQILFLQSTSNMSACWTYLGTALRCAQRMGLHRKYDEGFNPTERQLRAKMFYSIRNIEIFLHAILGLPRGMVEEDYDQRLPLELEDEVIASDSVSPDNPTSNKICSVTSFNAYTKLMTILADIVRRVYPIVPTHHSNARDVCLDTIETLHTRLEDWSNNLAALLRPDTKLQNVDLETYRQSRLLRYAYYHANLLLYRPYLHYLTSNDTETKDFRKCGEKARMVAISVLQLTEEIFTTEPTAFGHWFSIYATFFAGTVLLYCVTQERPVGKDRAQCLHYIEIAKQAIDLCSKCSLAAERCHTLLSELAHQVPTQESIRDAAAKTFDVVNERFGAAPNKSPEIKEEGTTEQIKPIEAIHTKSRSLDISRRPSQIAKGHRKTKSRNRSIGTNQSPMSVQQYPQTSNNDNEQHQQDQQYRQHQIQQQQQQQYPQHGMNDQSAMTDNGYIQDTSFGFQPYQMFAYDTDPRGHMQDTYQPNLGDAGFNEYSSLIHNPSLSYPTEMLQTLAMNQGTYPNNTKPEFSQQQWQYYGDSNSLGTDMPLVNGGGGPGLSGAEDAFIFPPYQADMYHG